jgi:FAD/FMN-containing dehydrogenase
MDPELLEELRTGLKGDVDVSDEALTKFSHDASIYELRPQVVVFPKDETDIRFLVNFVNRHKKKHPELSLTGRAAGTDMGGGSINQSIVVAFERYFNNPPTVKGNIAHEAQPGQFYRDFEKVTLKTNQIFPSYPASRELCAIGGIVNNNSGGEKGLRFGKTENYVKNLRMTLSDGNSYDFRALNDKELQAKLKLKTFEGDVYRKMFDLLNHNYDIVKKAKPNVHKNSAGYALWNVYDRETGIFDLTKLFCGAQGTLGLMSHADLELVPVETHHEMVVVFLKDIERLGEIINVVLPLQPESFESYDDNTLKLALKYFPEFAQKMGAKNIVTLGWQFLPEMMMVARGGLPKLVLQIDFAGNDHEALVAKCKALVELLRPMKAKTSIAMDDQEKKYWLIRRESFALLRNKIRDKHTAPFIDDFVVPPHHLPKFLPRFNKIIKKYPSLIYTVAGHVGEGNFHVIPLMDITKAKQRNIIPKLGQEVYDLVLEYGGSTTGEHNDGLVRTPYLEQMYGKQVYKLFEETKRIFDPQNIFNPRKKVGNDMDFNMSHIRMTWEKIKV